MNTVSNTRKHVRRSRFLRSDFRHDQRRLLDLLILNGCPAVGILVGLNPGLGLSLLLGSLLFAYAAIFYFFPESPSRHGVAHPSQPLQENAANGAAPVPWTEIVLLLVTPVATVLWLLYLVWMHTVLGKWGLGTVTVGAPVSVGLVSWFVVKHQEHHFKATGHRPPGLLVGGVIGLWVAAVFTFVVCLVSWICKYGLR